MWGWAKMWGWKKNGGIAWESKPPLFDLSYHVPYPCSLGHGVVFTRLIVTSFCCHPAVF